MTRSEMDMVENPERENLDTYNYMYSRTAYPHASVERIVLWTLYGELEAIAKDASVRQYFQSLIEKTNLDVTHTHSILINMLVYGDAYVRIMRDDKGNIVRLQHFSPKNVEINCDSVGNVTEFVVKFGNETFSYSPKDVLHFRWKPQQNSPYGTSILKGLEPQVARNNKIMHDFLKAFKAQARGRTADFDSQRNLRELKAIPYAIAEHTQVPIGLLMMKIENEHVHSLQMKEFEKLCQSIRDLIRNEIVEKIIKPETERKGFREVASIGWKRKSKPNYDEVERLMKEYKLGNISLEEIEKQVGLTEYYV